MIRALIVIVLLGLVGAAVVGLRSRAAGGEVSYVTAPVERGDLITTVTATGTLKAVVTVEVSSQLSGQVAEVHADFNDEVAKDQPIARLDQSILAAKVREAEAALEVARAQVLIEQAAAEKSEADLANARAARAVVDERTTGLAARLQEAKRDLERKEALAEKGTMSQSEVDRARTEHLAAASALGAEKAQRLVEDAAILSAEAAVRMARAEVVNAGAVVTQKQAALEQAEIELARTVIRSPIDGVVVGRDVDRGQTVAASLEAPKLFEIAQDLRRMELHAKVDEADIGRIRVGPVATFTVDSFPDRSFAGTVVQIRKAPEVVENVVTYTVVISAENPDLLLLPGMTAIVRVVVDETRDVLKLPNAALRFRPEGEATGGDVGEPDDASSAVAWVKGADGRPVAVALRIGATDGTATEQVEGPLGEGDEVIVGRTPIRDEPTVFGLRFGF